MGSQTGVAVSNSTPVVLVTGGGGFLGGAIVDLLLQRGCEVRSLSRRHYPELEAKGVQCFQADITDIDALRAAATDCDAVMHVAAQAGIWGPRQGYDSVNYRGTQAVIEACRLAEVQHLIYTSSPSVIQTDGDCEGADESLGYPRRYRTAYQASKAAAERAVVAANTAALSTVSLRPRLIWGPGDPHLVPRLVERCRAGRLRLVGSGDKLVDMTYITDAAQAHLDAMDRLLEAKEIDCQAACAGRAYFISSGEPKPFRLAVNDLMKACRAPLVTRSVPAWLAFSIGALCELIWTLFALGSEPPMTRFLARQLSTANWYDISAARADLGYEPAVDWRSGLAELKAHWTTDV
ncbi:MAG: 3-beta hydroxysteroid dehydrogenase [Myxococcales bacterium]|nr:3-beta hydroxysteroid dehydrogenase [Myxococcales bacterium]